MQKIFKIIILLLFISLLIQTNDISANELQDFENFDQIIIETIKTGDILTLSSMLKQINTSTDITQKQKLFIYNLILAEAADYALNENLLNLIIKSGAQINNTDLGYSPLCYAIEGNNLMSVIFLLKNGADPNEIISEDININGNELKISIPILYTAALKSQIMVDTLINYKANINEECYVFNKSDLSTIKFPIIVAIISSATTYPSQKDVFIAALTRLINSDVNLNIVFCNETALDVAINTNNNEMAELLKQSGAKTFNELHTQKDSFNLQNVKKTTVPKSQLDSLYNLFSFDK